MTIGYLWLPSLSGPPATAPLFAQQAAATLTTNPVPITATTTVGNYLIALVGVNGPTGPGNKIVGATDTKGNTWVVDADASSAQSVGMGILRTKLTSSLGSGDTVTISFNAGGGILWSCQILEFTASYFAVSPLDRANTNSLASAPTIPIGSGGGLAQPNELVVSGALHGLTATPTTWTPPASYTEVPIGVTNNVADAAYRQVNVASAISLSWTQTVSEAMAAVIATYKLL